MTEEETEHLINETTVLMNVWQKLIFAKGHPQYVIENNILNAENMAMIDIQLTEEGNMLFALVFNDMEKLI